MDNHNSKGTAKVIVVIIIAILITLSTAQIFLAAQVATTGREIRRLEQKRSELALRTSRLQTQINQVGSLGYVEQLAREELGMIDATGKIVYLEIPPMDYLASLSKQ